MISSKSASSESDVSYLLGLNRLVDNLLTTTLEENVQSSNAFVQGQESKQKIDIGYMCCRVATSGMTSSEKKLYMNRIIDLIEVNPKAFELHASKETSVLCTIL